MLSEYRAKERAGWEGDSEEEGDDTSLGGFIVSEGSDVEAERNRSERRGKRRKVGVAFEGVVNAHYSSCLVDFENDMSVIVALP